jgi:hypothetical protein
MAIVGFHEAVVIDDNFGISEHEVKRLRDARYHLFHVAVTANEVSLRPGDIPPPLFFQNSASFTLSHA